jgi:hypothetical protein
MNSTVLAMLKTKREAYQRYLQTRSDADNNLYTQELEIELKKAVAPQ